MTETSPKADRNITVLLADDEQWLAEPLILALKVEGYTVTQSTTGADTLAKIRSPLERPHLLILDMMMDPGPMKGNHEGGTRTGLVVLDVIRNELKLDPQSLPVICLTILGKDKTLADKVGALHGHYLGKANATLAGILELVQQLVTSRGMNANR